MTAEWVVYCALWSLCLSAGAYLIECVLRRGSAPLRVIWISALGFSVAGPVIGYVLPRASAPVPTVSSGVASPVRVVMMLGTVRHAAPSRPVMPATNVLGVVWATLSVAMLFYVVGGFVRLRQLRGRWRAAHVEGTLVMVSADIGPAVVGLLRSTIVIPEWVLEFEASRLSLVLRHEREHQRAGDASWLALAQFVLVAMPWNPVVWWQIRRLRLAIELDCDARVLRAQPDVRSYGTLLLEVGRPGRGLVFAGASLSGRAGELEQRIRMMTRKTRGVSRAAVMFSVAAGAVVVAGACGLPAPRHPAPAVAEGPSPAPATAAIAPEERPPVSSTPPTSRARGTARKDSTAALRAPDSTEVPLLAKLFDARLRGDSAETSVLLGKLRALSPFPMQSDSEAVAADITACSAGAGSDDSYIVKLLVPDSLARRDGRIEVNGKSAADARTSITLNDAVYGHPVMSCSMGAPGTLRLYGSEAFAGVPIVVNVTGPTSVIVTTGNGRLLAGPIIVTSDSRKYQMSWSAIPR